MPEERLTENADLMREVMILINKRLHEQKYISEEMYRKVNDILI